MANESTQPVLDALASMVARCLVTNEGLLRRLYNEPELARGAIHPVGRALVAELPAQEVGAQPFPRCRLFEVATLTAPNLPGAATSKCACRQGERQASVPSARLRRGRGRAATEHPTLDETYRVCNVLDTAIRRNVDSPLVGDSLWLGGEAVKPELDESRTLPRWNGMRGNVRPEQTPSSSWRRPVRLVIQGAALFGLWVTFSGDISVEFLAWGGIAAAVAVTFSELLFRGTHEHIFPAVPSRFAWHVRTTVRFLLYLPWMAYQITVASLHVAYLVLHPRIPIEPALVEFETSLVSEPAHVLLAQSITLTPGTVTVDAFKGTLLVHCLSRLTRESLAQGSIQRRVAGVFAEPAAERVELTDVLRPGQVPL